VTFVIDPEDATTGSSNAIETFASFGIKTGPAKLPILTNVFLRKTFIANELLSGMNAGFVVATVTATAPESDSIKAQSTEFPLHATVVPTTGNRDTPTHTFDPGLLNTYPTGNVSLPISPGTTAASKTSETDTASLPPLELMETSSNRLI
jgi:hypothetical protein